MTGMEHAIEYAAAIRRRERPTELRQARWAGFKAALGLGPNPLPRTPDERMNAALDAITDAVDRAEGDGRAESRE